MSMSFSLGATRTTNATTIGQVSISPIRNDSQESMPLQGSSKTKNIMEWKTQHVCEFLVEILGGQHQDVIQTIQKHQLSGVDMVEMTEKNLIELGIPTMHDRKQVLRAIRQSRNDPSSTYGKFKVRMLNPSTRKFKEVILKVSDNETKVKHILKQAFQVFSQAKCEISDFCLAKISTSSKMKTILSNETIFLSLLHEKAGCLDLFEICSGGDYVTQTSILNGSINTISAESPSEILHKGESSSLEQILQSPSEQPLLLDTLADEVPVFDRQQFLIPSFIERAQGPVSSEIPLDLKNNVGKRSLSRSSAGEGVALKIKARIGSGNIQNGLKERLTIKRQVVHRNQNASQMNSQGSQDQNNPPPIVSNQAAAVAAKQNMQQKLPINNMQPYVQNGAPPVMPQKQRQNSVSSQERFIGGSLNVMPQQRTINLNSKQNKSINNLRIIPASGVKQVSQSNANLTTLSTNPSDPKIGKKQIRATHIPTQQALQGNVVNSQQKPIQKPSIRPGMNMFQTMNEVPQNRIIHQRNSSKTSCYVAASDLTTERGKPVVGQQIGQYTGKVGTRQIPQHVREVPAITPEDETASFLQCSFDVQHTIQSVLEREIKQQQYQENQAQPLIEDLEEFLSEFLNQQKNNSNLHAHQKQAQRIRDSSNNAGHWTGSQSRQQPQQTLLEQDSLESHAFEEEFLTMQPNHQNSSNYKFESLVESQQAYFNELEQMQNNHHYCNAPVGIDHSQQQNQYQQQLKNKVVKHIQAKSIHTFANLTNQKKNGSNKGAQNPNNIQVKRQNYVNTYQTNYQSQQHINMNSGSSGGAGPHGPIKGCSQMLYGTFDNTLVSKTQFESGCQSKIERGSSVGDQFYTIDNTVKENIPTLNRVDFAPVQHQRQQALRKQPIDMGYGLESNASGPVLLSQQRSTIIGGPSHIKIKNIGLKIRATGFDKEVGGGLQRANTMGGVPGERLRSNSNNVRQQVNNRYGEMNDDGGSGQKGASSNNGGNNASIEDLMKMY